MSDLPPSSWTLDDTERWLTDYPLPATFKWNGERAYPRYTLKKGYGFWLRTAGPYHPALRGLFVLCHEVLATLPVGEPMPSQEQLATLVERYARDGYTPLFSAEDLAAPATTNPAENAPTYPGQAAAAAARAAASPATPPPDCPF